MIRTRSVVLLNPECWLAQHGRMEHDDPMPPCEGRLIRAHLIPQWLLHREGLEAGDPATYVMACGGLTGLTGHHGMFDVSRKLRVPLNALPEETKQFAIEHELAAWVARNYR